MTQSQIIKTIKKYKIKPTITRDVALFTFSAVGPAYTKVLKEKLGISYEVIGLIGGKNKSTSLINEEHIAREMAKVIEKNSSFLDEKIIRPIKKLFKIHEEKLEEARRASPKQALLIIADIYIDYLFVLGVYNCFMRYVGNEKSRGGLSPRLIKRLTKERYEISGFYPQIEKLVAGCAIAIGRELGIDGDLLRYLTALEMKLFVQDFKIDKKKLEELKKRRKHYLYLFVGAQNKEYIITDSQTIKKVKKIFNQNTSNISIIQGNTAYRGKVQGVVRNLETNKNGVITSNNIIVAVMTLVADAPLVSKAAGLITDEGGTLCHAAIVARELKKPCVIGTKIATKVLKDGDLVEVDADKGIIKILKNNK